jgi:hypothetical protein
MILNILNRTGPYLFGGNSNDGPMATENLFTSSFRHEVSYAFWLFTRKHNAHRGSPTTT